MQMRAHNSRTVILTCRERVAVVVYASSGHRLAAEQSIAVKVVTEFFQETEHVCDTTDSGEGQRVLLLVKKGWKHNSMVENSGQSLLFNISI